MCEIYGCGCEATEFGFGTFCKSCFDQIAKSIREQIAREIEEMPLGDVQAWQIVRSRAATIARGEK